MSAAAWPLQQAVFGAVRTALQSAPAVPVYDDVPAGAAEPYVVIGDMTAIPGDTVADRDENVTLTLHIWSVYRGRKEVREITGRIKTALHHARLTVTGWHLTDLRQEMAEDFLDADGVTRHGVIRYRARLSPA